MKVHIKSNFKDGSNHEIDIETTSPDEVAQVAKSITQLIMGELMSKIKDIPGIGMPLAPHDCWSDPNLMKDRIENLKKMEDLK